MQLTCCSPSPLWTVRRKLSRIHVMATQAFFLSSLSYIKIQTDFWLYPDVEFMLVLKKPCLKVTMSWENIPQKYRNRILLTLYLAFAVCCWGRILWSIHSWADVAQLLLCICGLKKLSVQWQEHSDFTLHEYLPLLAVACCRSGPVRVLISYTSDTLWLDAQ